jgi:hypothetical protein
MRYWLNDLEAVNLKDIHTVKELKDFVRYPNGTWAAKKGAGYHDDKVMAMLWNLIMLDDELITRYFEVLQTDKNNKPLKIKQFDFGIKYFMNPTSIYSGEGREDGYNDTTPIIIGNAQNTDSDIDQLMGMGWTPL